MEKAPHRISQDATGVSLLQGDAGNAGPLHNLLFLPLSLQMFGNAVLGIRRPKVGKQSIMLLHEG